MSSPQDGGFDFGSDDGSNSTRSNTPSEHSTPGTPPDDLDGTKGRMLGTERAGSTMESPRSPHPHLTNHATKKSRHTQSRSSSLEIKKDLWALHTDEIVSLAKEFIPLLAQSSSYTAQAERIIKNYVHYLWLTWSRCVWSLLVLPSSE